MRLIDQRTIFSQRLKVEKQGFADHMVVNFGKVLREELDIAGAFTQALIQAGKD